MATQSVSLTPEFEQFAAELVGSGRYANVADVLHAAMEALNREEFDDVAKQAYLERAIEDGFASGVAEGDVFARVRARAGLSPRAH